MISYFTKHLMNFLNLFDYKLNITEEEIFSLYFSETQFPPLLISTTVVLRHDNQELPVISDLPELAFQLVTAGVKTNCHYMYNTNTCTSSLIMVIVISKNYTKHRKIYKYSCIFSSP